MAKRVLRAKIDMAHPNMNMRDPILYRIRHAHHHQTGDAWPIYPTYDFAHGQEDAIEGVTHSDLHPGVRGSPPALRLVHREPAGAQPARASTSSGASTPATPSPASAS
jgi:hypothetical protein